MRNKVNKNNIAFFLVESSMYEDSFHLQSIKYNHDQI